MSNTTKISEITTKICRDLESQSMPKRNNADDNPTYVEQDDNVNDTDWRDIVNRNTPAKDEQIDESGDPDFILPYMQLDGDLIRKFRDTKLSATSRLAYDFIVMNASNIKEGISRPIDGQGLADFLGVQKARAYKIIADLEGKEFIVPRDEKARLTYYTPDIKKVNENKNDYYKSKASKKKAGLIEDKIYAIAKIFDVRFGVNGGFGFRPMEQNLLIEILTKYKKVNDIIKRLKPIIRKPISTENKEKVRQALTEIDKQYYRRR